MTDMVWLVLLAIVAWLLGGLATALFLAGLTGVDDQAEDDR
jgi:hypothetical protein